MRQYVDNPYRGSSFLASRKTIKLGLNTAFINLLRNHRKEFYAIPYVYDNGDVLFHVKIPSEGFTDNKIRYDILYLIKFDANRRYSLRDVTMYSNSPSFLYTYAYVYYHESLIIPFMERKFPLIALTKRPEVRNPVESLGYEKTTYFAARYLIDGMILNDGYINKHGKRMNTLEEIRLLNTIEGTDKLVAIAAHTRELKVTNHRKEIDYERRQKRAAIKQQYIIDEKRKKPKPKILARGPRSKITARTARRRLAK